jgi:hypothetical protein
LSENSSTVLTARTLWTSVSNKIKLQLGFPSGLSGSSATAGASATSFNQGGGGGFGGGGYPGGGGFGKSGGFGGKNWTSFGELKLKYVFVWSSKAVVIQEAVEASEVS